MKPQRIAKLIVDMSQDFVFGSLPVGQPAADIVPYIVEQLDVALRQDQIVVIVMDAHQENDPHFNRWTPHNIIGTEGQQLYGELFDWFEQHKHHPNVMDIPKSTYNAFFQTGLADKLRERGVRKVEIMGVCTDICVFLTANGADEEGFDTAIHRRGVATFTEHGDLFIEKAKDIFFTEVIE